MISSQQKEVLRVLNLKRQKQTNRRNAKVSSVYVITQEQIIGLWRKAATIEMVKKVFKLAMNVAQNIDRRHKLQKHRLLPKHVFRCLNEQPYLLLFENVWQISGTPLFIFIDRIARVLVVIDQPVNNVVQ